MYIILYFPTDSSLTLTKPKFYGVRQVSFSINYQHPHCLSTAAPSVRCCLFERFLHTHRSRLVDADARDQDGIAVLCVDITLTTSNPSFSPSSHLTEAVGRSGAFQAWLWQCGASWHPGLSATTNSVGVKRCSTLSTAHLGLPGF